MTLLETVEEIFAHIAVPQNLARKVASVKDRVATLEANNIQLRIENRALKAENLDIRAQAKIPQAQIDVLEQKMAELKHQILLEEEQLARQLHDGIRG